jgi:subfamily B ATP-binding cassette protein MsbA
MVGSVEIVDKEFNILEENQEDSGTRPVLAFSDGIELQNVSFTYNQKLDPVLKQLNVSIPVNTTIAIVGKSGAGKSTLIDLLTLLLKPQSGTLLIDGVPAQEVDLDSWRKQIGYVSQETIVFDDTVANNICLWQGDAASDAVLMGRIRKAARQAYIADYIETLPESYQTMVGDRGIRLSGGQRQRLFIARELFKQPNLLILDEATSALDTESERYIQESIDSLKGWITVVIIAHRLSTIRKADYVYVLEKGQVIEEGSYQKLTKKSGSRLGEMVAQQVL